MPDEFVFVNTNYRFLLIIENDLVSLLNDMDILIALQTSKTIKLTIYSKCMFSINIHIEEFGDYSVFLTRMIVYVLVANNASDEKASEEINAGDMAKELHIIRNSIDKFLEHFEQYLKIDASKGIT